MLIISHRIALLATLITLLSVSIVNAEVKSYMCKDAHISLPETNKSMQEPANLSAEFFLDIHTASKTTAIITFKKPDMSKLEVAVQKQTIKRKNISYLCDVQPLKKKLTDQFHDTTILTCSSNLIGVMSHLNFSPETLRYSRFSDDSWILIGDLNMTGFATGECKKN
ncbi:MAG: hypothetical protein R3261_14360 [Alphaproteobacteria bacterium]|nr:hypothetical protein [Alphaproteobacteria bacterium]